LKKLGVVAALPMEGRALAGQRLQPKTRMALHPDTLLYLSGMGPARAKRVAQALIAAGAGALASWGTAGGLDPALPSAALLIPSLIAGPDADPALPSDTVWHERMCKRLQGTLDVYTSPLVSTENPVGSAAAKARLFSHGYAGVDMESYAVAACAHNAGLPFIAIRAITDPAQAVLPRVASEAMSAAGRLQWSAFGKALVASNRHDIIALIRLSYATRHAQRTLANVRRLAGANLLAP
jgi:adenosylhomocysteine nucleosidase